MKRVETYSSEASKFRHSKCSFKEIFMAEFAHKPLRKAQLLETMVLVKMKFFEDP